MKKWSLERVKQVAMLFAALAGIVSLLLAACDVQQTSEEFR